MFDVIMSKLGGSTAELAREGIYEVYYGDMFVKPFESLSEAERFKTDNFNNLNIVKIKRKGE
jgi:hypothetical protein